MGFGQSFQITPLQLLRAISASVNGGRLITPHVGLRVTNDDNETIEEFDRPLGRQVITEETSAAMREILEEVVSAGTGARTYLPGFRIGGKTATSEKLPRRSGKYISSFVALAPAEHPEVIAIVLVDEPQGAYYGGLVTGPVMKALFELALPHLEIERHFNEEELLMPGVPMVAVPDLVGMSKSEIKDALKDLGLEFSAHGDGDIVSSQFPIPGENVNQGMVITVFMRAN